MNVYPKYLTLLYIFLAYIVPMNFYSSYQYIRNAKLRNKKLMNIQNNANLSFVNRTFCLGNLLMKMQHVLYKIVRFDLYIFTEAILLESSHFIARAVLSEFFFSRLEATATAFKSQHSKPRGLSEKTLSKIQRVLDSKQKNYQTKNT